MKDLAHLNQKGFNKYATMMGIHFVSLDDGVCVGEIEIREDHFHPGMIVHGGVAYGLADSTMAMAVLSTCKEGENASTIECKMSYLAAVTEGVMRAESRIIKRGRNIVFLESVVKVGEKVVSTASATFAIIRLQ